MKKILSLILFSVLTISLVLAAQGDALMSGQKGNSQEVNYSGQENGNITRLRAEDFQARTQLEITSENEGNETRLRVQLSNGRNAEIKVMPETASLRAIERLGLKVCNETNNCTIQLKEVGNNNETRAVYEIQAEKQARVLGMFKTKMNVTAQIDAETEEVLKAKKPWWAFIASE